MVLGRLSDLLIQIPFLITGIISIHVLFFMVFAKWKIKKDDNSFSIITGWAYLWWGVEVPTDKVKTIGLVKVPKLKNEASEEDHFKVEAKKMKVKCCWLLSPFRKKRPDYINEYGFGKFMTDDQKIKLIDLLKVEKSKKEIIPDV